MIKSTELRLNNWLKPKYEYHNQFHGYGKITTIYQDKVVVNNHYPQKWFEPIPLSEEILLKAGFRKSKHSVDWYITYIDKYYFEINVNTIGFVNIGIDKTCFNVPSIDNIPCTYLHDLQNKIYAITQAELTINL